MRKVLLIIIIGDAAMSQPHKNPYRESTTGAPRWVKVFGVIAIILVVLFVVVHLTGLTPVGHGR